MGNLSIVGNIFEDVAIKAPCLVATTGSNITLSGVQTIDGVTVGNNGERVLVKDQTDKTTNGIYQASTGPWIRTTDASKNTDFVFATLVTIAAGATQAGGQFVQGCADNPVLIGTSLITFVPLANLLEAATSTTSTSSVTIGTGSKTFAVKAGLGFAVNEWVLAWETSNPGNVMQGQVTAYAGTALTANMVSSYGSGTHTDWTIALSSSPATIGIQVPGPQGPQGPPGASGTAQNFDTVAAAAAATIPNTVNGIRTLGNLVPGDGGHANYIHASGSTIGGFQSADGQWWQLGAQQLNDAMFGAVGDGVTDDHIALNALMTAGAGGTVYLRDGKSFNLVANQLTVPDNTTVICGRNTSVIRSADPSTIGFYTSAMISLGNRCRWSGGVLNSTTVTSTSATSQAISTGSKTFAVPAGVAGFTNGQFLRFQSRGNGANHMEGTITSYAGTSLTVNITFAAGSGTLNDWNINIGNIFQCPIVLHNVTETVVENVRVIGTWYVGLLMEAWNSAGGTLLTSLCTFRNCFVESVQNRGFYFYGTCSDNVIEDCFVNGNVGVTDYGVNLNPANATGSANSQLRNKIIGTDVNATRFQGFELGDFSDFNVIADCSATSLVDSTGVGFLVQTANAGTAQYNKLESCVANACPGEGFAFIGVLYGGASGSVAVACGVGFYIAPSGSTQSNFVTLDNCEADASTTIGFRVVGNSNRCDLNHIKAINNGTNGVQIDAGATVTRVSGRSTANISVNLVDNGTGSVTGDLTQT